MYNKFISFEIKTNLSSLQKSQMNSGPLGCGYKKFKMKSGPGKILNISQKYKKIISPSHPLPHYNKPSTTCNKKLLMWAKK